MTMAALSPIGPATEARIAAAFQDACVITAQKAAQLLGMDTDTLRDLTDDQVIRAVRRGGRNTRGYTEGDIRAYLTESAAPCRFIEKPKAGSGITTSSTKVVAFTARRASKANARPNR